MIRRENIKRVIGNTAKKFIIILSVVAMLSTAFAGCGEEKYKGSKYTGGKTGPSYTPTPVATETPEPAGTAVGTLTGTPEPTKAAANTPTNTPGPTKAAEATVTPAPTEVPKRTFTNGTAGDLEGRCLILTVFVSMDRFPWNFTTDEDNATYENVCRSIGVATDYIKENCKKYGKDVEFIYDYLEDWELSYFTDIGDYTERYDDIDYAMIYGVGEYVDYAIDIDTVMDKYDADNLLFVYVANTDAEQDFAYTCCRPWYDGFEWPFESVIMYNYDCGVLNPPSVYAHEICHLFGAPDLYNEEYADYNFTKEFYNEYVRKNATNDIMFTCMNMEDVNYVYDRITNEIGPVTAYYLGLSDDDSIIKKYKLRKSEH